MTKYQIINKKHCDCPAIHQYTLKAYHFHKHKTQKAQPHKQPHTISIVYITTTLSRLLRATHYYSSLQVMWLTLCTALVGCLPEGSTKRWMVKKVLIQCFGVLSSALSSVVNYHNIENRPLNGICVANHTSPIDVLMLMCDNCYSLVSNCPVHIYLSYRRIAV